MSVENTGVDETNDMTDNNTTLSGEFARATSIGQAAAASDSQLPKRTPKPKRSDEFAYATKFLSGESPEMIFTLLMESDHELMYNFLTEQMSAKAGLKKFGERGANTIMDKLRQLLYRQVMKGRKHEDLTREDKKKALQYLMFLKEKRSGKIKGRGCADGRKQRLYKSKEETSLPTISLEALLITCIIDAMERRCVATCDIPSAFMQADMDG